MKIPKIRAKKISRKAFYIVAFFELLLALVMVYIFIHSISINSNDAIQYAKKEQADIISCTNGSLCVNNVEVPVPLDDNPSYNISYSWAEDDTDYPSVPTAAIASFPGPGESTLFDISLYKDSFVPTESIPDNKNADNWFDGWEKNNDSSDIKMGKLSSGDIHGFFISSINEISDEENRTYANYSYYFTSQEDDGISVYILEGTLYDPASSDKFMSIITNCIKNISIKMQNAEDLKSSAISI